MRLFRVEAGLALGLLHVTKGERFEAADVYYEAIGIGEGKVNEQQMKMEKKTLQFNTDMMTIQEIMHDVLVVLRGNLNSMQGNQGRMAKRSPRSDGARAQADPLEVYIELPIGLGGMSLTPEQMSELVRIGGVTCDCCKKKDVELFNCARCGKAFYCSKECQKKQWKVNGHKQRCRKDGEFKAGDMVRLNGLTSKPELNNKIVRAVGPAPQEGRWEVCMEGGDTSLSIGTKNMQQLRPFDCLQSM